jgi:hypothetical protein
VGSVIGSHFRVLQRSCTALRVPGAPRQKAVTGNAELRGEEYRDMRVERSGIRAGRRSDPGASARRARCLRTRDRAIAWDSGIDRGHEAADAVLAGVLAVDRELAKLVGVAGLEQVRAGLVALCDIGDRMESEPLPGTDPIAG